MTERDDHAGDRRRPARPAWATVPTMQWSRVAPDELLVRPDEPGEDEARVETATTAPEARPDRSDRGGEPARGVARPSRPARRETDGPDSGAQQVPEDGRPSPPAQREPEQAGTESGASAWFTTPASRHPGAPDETAHDDAPARADTSVGDGAGRRADAPPPDGARRRDAPDDPRTNDGARTRGGAARPRGVMEHPQGNSRRSVNDRRRAEERPTAGPRPPEQGPRSPEQVADRDGRGGPHRRDGDPRREGLPRRDRDARRDGGSEPRRVRTPPAAPVGAPARPKPRYPLPGEVFTGEQGPPRRLRPDLAEALLAPTPPGGLRYDAAPVSGSPYLGAPVSAPPVSGVPVSAAPVSAPPEAEFPVSGGPGDEFDRAEALDRGDPEHDLAIWEFSFDPDTLREVVDDEQRLRDIRDRLTAKLNAHDDNAPRARLLSLRAVASRILGDLQKAQADAKLALAHAEATGELRRIAITQARLAHVLQWRGEFEEADRLFALANSTELPDRLRATMHQHAGKCAFDQGRYMEACNHFEKALELRKIEDPEMIAQTELALDAVFRKVAENGWGPYPRGIEEILQVRRSPVPVEDEQTGLWGFAEPDGEPRIVAAYSDVQPFRDSVAWVQRPGQDAWELIDESGATLIPASAGYLGVSSFSDGLAWVSRDGTARWIAIDKANTVTISTGFEDVRPFRRGMAAVRRGGRWGAVDGIGRAVVPFRYDSFATAMSDGRYIDGFSDEGLAVVELAGRKGVVDRSGRVLVEPVHPALVIHPVAFLITDGGHRWGALDRRGRLLIAPSHPSRMAVTEEIDRLLVDARPML